MGTPARSLEASPNADGQEWPSYGALGRVAGDSGSVEGRIDEAVGAMKKKALSQPINKKSSSTNEIRAGLNSLFVEVRSLVHSARQAAATAVNTLQVLTNFEIGRRIFEYEQKGATRASYGTELLNVLSIELTQEFGSGFSATNLKLMRQFFVEYSRQIGHTLSDQSVKPKALRAISSNSTNRFRLSWSYSVSHVEQASSLALRCTATGPNQPTRLSLPRPDPFAEFP